MGGFGIASIDMKQLVKERESLFSNSTVNSIPLNSWLEKIGTEIGVSDWFPISQERVNAFAVTTGDPQWIHTQDAAEMGSPFGKPIAHGFLTLSLCSMLIGSIMPPVDNVTMGINYGKLGYMPGYFFIIICPKGSTRY